MQEAVLVTIELHAGRAHLVEERIGCERNESAVRFFRDQDSNIDAAKGGELQRLHDGLIRDEIRAGDPDAPRRRIDCLRVHQGSGIDLVGRSAGNDQ